MVIRLLSTLFVIAIGLAGQRVEGASPVWDDLPPVRPGADDWPWWCGPNRDNIAAPGQTPPVRWSETENVLWKVDVPGRGHGSPCLWGDRIFLPTADDQAEVQSLLCYDRRTGQKRWQTELHRKGFLRQHSKNSHASATPACDGERVFMPCVIQDAIWLSALDLDGKIVWQRRLGDFQSMHGFAASPLVYRSLVIVAADNLKNSFLVALHRRSGKEIWRTGRPDYKLGTYASPTVGRVAGRDQLLLHGPMKVFSYDPLTGKELWTCDGPSESSSSTMTLGRDFVYSSVGFPQRNMLCIRGDGSGDVTRTRVVWSKKDKMAYVPSLLLSEGLLTMVADEGPVTCFEAATGKVVWTTKLQGQFSSSPVLAGGHIYVANEKGVAFVFKSGRTFELVARNDLADGGFATPVICSGRIYLRTLHWLYCLGHAVAPLALTVPKGHPRIGITSEDLDRVRGNIQKEPWAGLWNGVLARSAWVRRGQLDPKAAFGGVGGQGVRFRMTEGLECVALHALVAKDAAAAKALSDFFEAWDPAPLEKDIAATDFMSSGEFFEGLAVVLDWTWDVLSERARARLLAIVERRAKHNYDGFIGKKSWEAVIEANNHSMASMGALGLAAIALWHENPDAPRWAGLVHAKMNAYLASSFDADGGCYEGSMYGPFGLFRILPFSDCCARFGGGDAMAGGFLSRVMNQLTNELVPGRDRMLPINDTDGNYLRWGGTLFLYDASHYKNPISRWAWTDLEKRRTGSGGHARAFAPLWEDGLAGGKPSTRLVAVTRGRGTLTVRTGCEKDDFLAAFECGKRIPGTHGQSDVGHFLIYAKGRCLAADTGYSNEAVEGSPHQSVGHNLVLVDGKGEVITGNGQTTEGKLVQWEERKTLVWAQADLAPAFAQNNYNPMAVAQRCFIVLTGPDPYVVIADAFVKDAKDHAYTWLLHGNAHSKFDLARDRATHVSGDAALDIAFCLLDSGAIALDTKTFPSQDFGDHPMLRATFQGNRWLGLTVLTPRRSSEAAANVKREIQDRQLVVTVDRSGSKDEITLTTAPNRSIAALRVVRTMDGRPVAEDLLVK